jgi:protein tyrosine phosphatase (PTP) superfamily phosphohydrolase (DUF442 family)
MTIVKINDHLSVSDQPDPAGFGDLAARGFAAILNARRSAAGSGKRRPSLPQIPDRCAARRRLVTGPERCVRDDCKET